MRSIWSVESCVSRTHPVIISNPIISGSHSSSNSGALSVLGSGGASFCGTSSGLGSSLLLLVVSGAASTLCSLVAVVELLLLALALLVVAAGAAGAGVTLVRGIVCLAGLTGRFVLRAALASLAIRQSNSRKVQRRRNILSARKRERDGESEKGRCIGEMLIRLTNFTLRVIYVIPLVHSISHNMP